VSAIALNTNKASNDFYDRALKDSNVLTRDEESLIFQSKYELEAILFQKLFDSNGILEALSSLILDAMDSEDNDRKDQITGILSDINNNIFSIQDKLTHSKLLCIWESIYDAVLATESDTELYYAKLNSLKKDLSQIKNKIVQANLRLVVSLTRFYNRKNQYTKLSDLIQDGNIGLILAVDKFDWTYGVKFATYAAWWIKHGLRASLKQQEKLVRLPSQVIDKLYKINQLNTKHLAMTGEDMSIHQLAKTLDTEEVRMEELVRVSKSTVASMDAPVYADNDTSTLHDLLTDSVALSQHDVLQRNQLTKLLNKAMAKCLRSIEKEIIIGRFALDGNEPLTLQAIADKHKLSRERIRQLENSALRKLRNVRGINLKINL
jgi:RNA polymerase sigma factor (sigma-70 family)